MNLAVTERQLLQHLQHLRALREDACSAGQLASTEEPTSAGPTLAPGMQRYCESGTGILFRGSLQIHTRELSNRSIQPAEPTPWLPALGTVM